MLHFVCIERPAYWLVWISITIYALYKFAFLCQDEHHLRKLEQADLKDGFLNENYYDDSDFEWQSFKRIYINYWYIVFIHLIISTVFTAYNQPMLKLASWISITLYATYTIFSTGALVVVVINVIMLILLAILGKNFLSYVLCFGVVMASQSTEIANRIFNTTDPRETDEFDFEEKRFLFTYCICFLNARGLSSALDTLTIRQKKEIQSGKEKFYEKLITIAAYLLYLPGFFAGPIYLYDDFEKATRQVKAEPKERNFIGSNYFKSMGSLFMLMLNALYFEWLLHWLYSTSVASEQYLVTLYDNWQMAGFIVSLFLLFYLKYCCIIGTFKVLATFDGVDSIAPPVPQCPASMHLTSTLWRTFDVGLYRWLKKYVYLPIAQSGSSIFYKLIATNIVFVCVGLWHLPITPTLLLWLSLNFMTTMLEIMASTLSNTKLWISIKKSLSAANYLRLLALIGLPIFLTAILSNVFFLSENEELGLNIAHRIFDNTNNFAVFLLLALYCGANVSLDYNQVVKSSSNLLSPYGFPSCPRNRIKDQEQSKKHK